MAKPNTESQVYLITKIVVVYVFVVLLVIFSLNINNIDITKVTGFPFANKWLCLIWSLYYCLPVVLSVLFGLYFPPFGRSFRNLFIAFFTVAFFYSMVMFGLREYYLQKVKYLTHWSKHDQLKIAQSDFKYVDKNQDGFLDELTLNLNFDLTRIRHGDYILDAVIIPGAGQAPVEITGGGEIHIETRGDSNVFMKTFTAVPKDLVIDKSVHKFLFQIKLTLSRIYTVDKEGHKLLEFSRWSPFLRQTDWDGHDQEICDSWIVISKLILPQSFSFYISKTD